MVNVTTIKGEASTLVSFSATQSQLDNIARELAALSKREGMSISVESGSVDHPDDVKIKAVESQVIFFIEGLTREEMERMNGIIRDVYAEVDDE